jgi:large subunit ribosomal protein L4
VNMAESTETVETDTVDDVRVIDVYTPSGETDGTVELPVAIFGQQANIALMHQVVVAQQAAARQGTHSTKTRGDVRGGGRKPYRQKGTGRARQGSTRAPQFTGGGVSHGPHPRDYSQRTPKKMKAAALRGALSDRARNDRVHVLTAVTDTEGPSTKVARQALANLVETRKALVVLTHGDDLGRRSVRNLAEVHVLTVDQLNTYDVLVNDDIVFTRDAFDALIAGPAHGRSAKAVASSAEVSLAETSDGTEVEESEL